MDDNLQISVVIATYNRAETLPLVLEHLARQTLAFDRFEVIIADDGSTDNTEEVVRRMSDDLPMKISYLKHPNSGPCYTQNAGIKMAVAPIVCLIADDILFEPRALEAFLESHVRHPEPNAAILGKVVQSPEMRSLSVFLAKWDPFKFKTIEGLDELPYYLFWACNISCKRDFLLEAGLYNEEIREGNAHEDVEFGYRLSQKGLRIFYNAKACASHHHITTLQGAIRKAYQRGMNWKEFRSLVDDPAISVRYHVLNGSTLRDHFLTFSRLNNQVGADAKLPSLLINHLVRLLLFNALTVPYFWLPVMTLAESNRMVAACMHTQFYRGAIYYFFLKGIKDVKDMSVASIRERQRCRWNV